MFANLRQDPYVTLAKFVMIDIDKFKEFNDGNGHEAGDSALNKVVRSIKAMYLAKDNARNQFQIYPD